MTRKSLFENRDLALSSTEPRGIFECGTCGRQVYEEATPTRDASGAPDAEPLIRLFDFEPTFTAFHRLGRTSHDCLRDIKPPLKTQQQTVTAPAETATRSVYQSIPIVPNPARQGSGPVPIARRRPGSVLS